MENKTEKIIEKQILDLMGYLKHIRFVEVEELQTNYVPYTNDINKGK